MTPQQIKERRQELNVTQAFVAKRLGITLRHYQRIEAGSTQLTGSLKKMVDVELKKLSKSSKVIRYIKKNPNAKAKEVSQATGVPPQSVYQIAYNLRKQMREGMAKVQMTALSPTAAAPKVSKGRRVVARLKMKDVFDMVNHPPHYKEGIS